MADVEIILQGGVKVKVPEDQAALYTEARQKDKQEREQLGLAVTAAKAEKEAEAAKLLKAEQDKQAIELAKKGEVDQVRELLTKENKATVDKLAAKYRDTHLEAMISRSVKIEDEKLRRVIIGDALAQLRSSCQFDLEKDTLVVIGADGRPALAKDGKPQTADAYLTEYLDERPHMRSGIMASGSGAAGSGKGSPSIQSITVAEYNAALSDPGKAQQIAKAIAAKTMTVKG